MEFSVTYSKNLEDSSLIWSRFISISYTKIQEQATLKIYSSVINWFINYESYLFGLFLVDKFSGDLHVVKVLYSVS